MSTRREPARPSLPHRARLACGLAAFLACALTLDCAGPLAVKRGPADGAVASHVERGRLLFADNFRGDLSRWVIEQQPGGSVTAHDGRLVIADRAGCTVWWRKRLEGAVVISFEATVSSAARVSDLNAFWMASDPSRPGDLFAAGHGRDGRFDTYNGLLTYYVGYGGNNNSTTRFRRYVGNGSRPLRPEHDLRAERYLLEADRSYRIELIACAERVQYVRDGEIVFDVLDPRPLRAGWFGFRTVDSHIEVRDFRVTEARCP